MNDDFEGPIDKAIREARERGDFDNLPGKGQPFHWEDDSEVPQEQRLAQRLLKSNDFTVDWIALGQELDAAYAAIQQEAARARAGRDSGQLSPAQWRIRARAIVEKIQALNKRVVGYNMRAPDGPAQRKPYPIDPDLKNA